MNKPSPNLQPVDEDLEPLDEHGEQIWSSETEAAIMLLQADPKYLKELEEGLADVAAGRMYSHEEVFERMAERKRLWRVERGL